MKKTLLTAVILLGLGLSTYAQFDGGGIFKRGPKSNEYFSYRENYEGGLINLPPSHGSNEDSSAPVGSGIVVLVSLGAAYMVGKKHKEKA